MHRLANSELFTVDPFPFQDRGISYALKNKYVIIGDEMGLGKTLQSMGVGLKTNKKTLVVAPAYLRENWWQEIEKLAATYTSQITIRNASDVKKYFSSETDFIIISYHFIQQAEELFKWADIVIADECQALKSLDTNWTLTFHYMIETYRPEYLILTSGTPIKNNVVEWFSPLVLMGYCPDRTNGLNVTTQYKDLERFARHFSEVDYVEIPGGRVVKRFYGLKNREKLKELLKGKYIRRYAKTELGIEEPLRQDIIVDYSSDRELFDSWTAFTSGKLGQKTNISAKAKSASNKASFTKEFAKDLYHEHKSPIVIFTDHLESGRIISEGLKCPFIHGNMKNRQTYVDEFQKGKIKYICGTIGAMSTGFTLTRSNIMVFNDRSWVPADNWQAERRINRISQKNKCYVYDVIGSRQDRHIRDLNRQKEEVLRKAT